MTQRSIFPPTPDAPIRLRLVIGWGLFFLFVLAGLGLLWRHGASVVPLLGLIES